MELSDNGEAIPNDAAVNDSFFDHEKAALLEKTKSQENELMILRLKLEAFQEEKKDYHRSPADVLCFEERIALEEEIAVLRGKVALLERNNRIFSNDERKELKQELERNRKRLKRLSQQLSVVRSSVEYDRVSHVERALENFMKKVKGLEKENEDLRLSAMSDRISQSELFTKIIRKKEEIIKDQKVLIEEQECQLQLMCLSGTSLQKSGSSPTFFHNSIPDSAEMLSSEYSSTLPQSHLTKSAYSKNLPLKGSVIQSESSKGDVNALHDMCFKMREDIEKAKTRLKDMGEALESVPHLSPRSLSQKHVPKFLKELELKSKIESSEQSGSTPLSKSLPGFQSVISSAHRKNLGQPNFFSTSEVTHCESRSRHYIENKCEAINPDRFDDATEFQRISTHMTPNRDKNSYISTCLDENSTINKNTDWEAEENLSKSCQLLPHYQFLSFQCLDHKFLEFQQESRRIALLELMKLQHQSQIENSQIFTTSLKKRLSKSRAKLYCCNHENDLVQHKILLDSNSFQKSLQRAATHCVYAGRKKIFPSEQTNDQKMPIVFSKIQLSTDDVVLSLGAAHYRDDETVHQLVQVNKKIGLVPFSDLVMTDEIHDFDNCESIVKKSRPADLKNLVNLHEVLEHQRHTK